LLSQDYGKLAFLHADRYVELHSQAGRYYRLRIPVFGRDMVYQPETAELLCCGAGSTVYRISLDQGRFLSGFETAASSLNCCAVMPGTGLVVTGGPEGRVEAWDSRARHRVATLDTALSCPVQETGQLSSVPGVSCLAARDSLNLAVGSTTGQVLLYDIRAGKPVLTKDHHYGLPIKRIVQTTAGEQELVLSLDSQVVRVWDRQTGKPHTSIESTAEFNDLVIYPGSGLLFLANEQPRMQVFYIPSLGPAPRWAAFLDSVTEELEESRTATVYDDYKFVTMAELQELGLDHLLGSPLLRAHLHGYFMDIRLYRKAASVKPANKLENMKKDLIKSQIEAQRAGRVKIESKVPKVNKDLFIKLKVDEEEKKKKKKNAGDLLNDDRFGALFSDDRFEVDKDDETYRLINPVINKLDKDKKKAFELKYGVRDDEQEERQSGDSDVEMEDSDEAEESSSDDDVQLSKDLKREHRSLKQEKEAEKRVKKVQKQSDKINKLVEDSKRVQHTLKEVKEGDEFANISEKKSKVKKSKRSLEDRLSGSGDVGEMVRSDTGHAMTFAPEKSKQKLRKEIDEREHRQERLKVRRSAKSLKKDKLPPKFWMGKRVK